MNSSCTHRKMPPNVTNVGYLLLDRVERLKDQSASELDKNDCVLLKSSRSDGASRAIHRCIIEVGSAALAEELHNVCTSSVPECSNTINLDMSIDIMDIIVKYLYIREPVKVTPSLIIPLYAAAKRYELTEIEEQIKRFCESNFRMFLKNDALWNTSIGTSDFEAFTNILDSLSLDAANKVTLMHRVFHWAIGGKDGAEIASKFNQKLLLQPSTSSPQTEPTSQSRWKPVLAIEGKNIGGDYYEVHVLCLKNKLSYSRTLPHSNISIPEDQLTVPSDRSDFKYSVNEATLSRRSVIMNNRIYNGIRNHVNVYSFKSRQPFVNIKCLSSDDIIENFITFNTQLFVHTKNKIYQLDNEKQTFNLVLNIEKNFHLPVTVVDSDCGRTSFAVQELNKRHEILMYSTNAAFKSGIVRMSNTHRVPSDLDLIGSHEKMLYFVPWSAQKNPFYAAFREHVEVKRRYLGCSYGYRYKIFNGLLSCFAEINETQFLLVIDLTSDRVLFRRPLSDLGLTGLKDIIPIIGECSDLQPVE